MLILLGTLCYMLTIPLNSIIVGEFFKIKCVSNQLVSSLVLMAKIYHMGLNFITRLCLLVLCLHQCIMHLYSLAWVRLFYSFKFLFHLPITWMAPTNMIIIHISTSIRYCFFFFCSFLIGRGVQV